MDLRLMIKKSLIGVAGLALLLELSGCGLVFNHSKPSLRDEAAIQKALELGLITNDPTFYVLDTVFLFGYIFPGLISLMVDSLGGYTYQVVDPGAYQAWAQTYKEKEAHQVEPAK